MLPRSLHFAADTPKYGAEEKIGHSGRDDGVRKRRAHYMIFREGRGWGPVLEESGEGSSEGRASVS